MATLTVQNVAQTGLNPTRVAVSATGNTFANDGRTILSVENTATASRTLTVYSTTACNQGSTHNISVVCGASDDRIAGTFDPARFGTTVSFDTSATAGITIAAVRV